MPEGLIRKAVGGFYYVETPGGVIVECRARGVFRNQGVSPMAGDRVEITCNDDESGTVSAIAPRKNEIVRPPIANLDTLFLVVSVCEPEPSTQVIDAFTAVCEHKGIEPVLLFTKNDLGDTAALEELYRSAGFTVLSLNYRDQACIPQVKELMAGRLSAFAGNTGAGKSSLLNLLYPDLALKTAEISRKLRRGRHTTRHVELYPLPDVGGYVADTPGFGSMDVSRYDTIRKEELQYCFREFAPFLDGCQFTGCSHTVEKGCAVLRALEDGAVCESRHQSYCALYEDARQIKDWEHKKGR